MLSAVLFDLDGTLLDIDLDSFLREYFAALGPVVAEVLGTDEPERRPFGGDRRHRGHVAPPPGHDQPRGVQRLFHAMTNADLDLEEFALPFERFYREVFPALRRDFGPMPGARRAVETCLELGLKVAIATNPIFPRSAVDERMRWAGLGDLEVRRGDHVREHARHQAACGVLRRDGRDARVAPASCVMVGDDRALDMPAAGSGHAHVLRGR